MIPYGNCSNHAMITYRPSFKIWSHPEQSQRKRSGFSQAFHTTDKYWSNGNSDLFLQRQRNHQKIYPKKKLELSQQQQEVNRMKVDLCQRLWCSVSQWNPGPFLPPCLSIHSVFLWWIVMFLDSWKSLSLLAEHRFFCPVTLEFIWNQLNGSHNLISTYTDSSLFGMHLPFWTTPSDPHFI